MLNLNIFNYLRSLSFGGLMGIGIAAYLYLRYPQWFKGNVTFDYFIVFGGLLGAAIHSSIGAMIRALLFPLVRFVDYYSKIIQIEFLHRHDILNSKVSRDVIHEVTKAYFLRDTEKNRLPRG